MGIERIDYLNKEADYKPTCHRCGYNITPVWVFKDINKNDEWVCQNCLSNDELDELLLSEFGFDRNNMRNLTEEESEACQRALSKMSEPTGVKLFD